MPVLTKEKWDALFKLAVPYRGKLSLKHTDGLVCWIMFKAEWPNGQPNGSYTLNNYEVDTIEVRLYNKNELTLGNYIAKKENIGRNEISNHTSAMLRLIWDQVMVK